MRFFMCVGMVLLSHVQAIWAQDSVSVAIEWGKHHPVVIASAKSGSYVLMNGSDTLFRLLPDDAIQFKAVGDSMVVSGLHHPKITLANAKLVPTQTQGMLLMKFDAKPKAYPDEMWFAAAKGRLKVVNRVMLDQYTAYVVQAEGGGNHGAEYHRIQAILCRTYAVRNGTRHWAEGYDMCDRQHCQVYDPERIPTFELAQAVASTSGMVVIDKDSIPIDAAYHANCGGQTANCEDVWTQRISYLRSVRDPYCRNARSTHWTVKADTAKVFSFLRSEGLRPGPNFSIDSSKGRVRTILINKEPLSMNAMRSALGLRSSWFDVRTEGAEVVIDGRGFGHGVGLCQQGAMEMVKKGNDFRQVLGFYYTGTRLADLHGLHYMD